MTGTTASGSPQLIHRETRRLNKGTHRPEILVTAAGNLFLVVVEPGEIDGRQVKHRAYKYDSSFNPLMDPFPVTWITDEYGEPADHRATISGGDLAIVYQSLVMDPAIRCRGPAEQCAVSQSLLLARFDTHSGEELFNAPIVAGVQDFQQDNFPDHCLLNDGEDLLVGSGSMSGLLKIRRVARDASILETREIMTSDSSIPADIGNSMLRDADGQLFIFSATAPGGTAELTMTTLDSQFEPGSVSRFPAEAREQNFPTGNLFYNGYYFISYISRERGGPVPPEENPYYPYLMVLNGDREVVYDQPVGDGTAGFAHVHPTVARLGDRLFVAWSSQAGGDTPQVVVEEYELSFP